MGQQILLVEDDPALARMLSNFLEKEGYRVQRCSDGETGLASGLSGGFDLMLLDWMLPSKSGLDICRALRHARSSVRILMLTGRGEISDKVAALRMGADDYITKPFDLSELSARIEALLRRGPTAPAASRNRFQFADVEVDIQRGEVWKNGLAVSLSTREFQLLRYLIDHRGETLSRHELLTEVWRNEALPSTRTVDVHISWLRQKLEETAKHPQMILTVRGLGYKFAV